MIDAIVENFDKILDLLTMKQRLMNEARLKYNQQSDNVLTDMITNIQLSDLKEIRQFLQPFEV